MSWDSSICFRIHRSVFPTIFEHYIIACDVESLSSVQEAMSTRQHTTLLAGPTKPDWWVGVIPLRQLPRAPDQRRGCKIVRTRRESQRTNRCQETQSLPRVQGREPSVEITLLQQVPGRLILIGVQDCAHSAGDTGAVKGNVCLIFIRCAGSCALGVNRNSSAAAKGT